jgi:cell division protein FtsW
MLHKSRPKFTSKENIDKKIDLPILLTILGLVSIGLIIVYDVSVVQAFRDYGDKYFYIKQQLIWTVLGFCCLTFFSFFNYRFFRKLALPLFVISFILLLLVLIPGFGVSAGGAHRWLRLGPISIQPAEIIKLASVIFFASLFEKGPRLGPFALCVVAISLVVGLLQKDLGSTVVFFLTALVVYLIAGAPLQYFLALIPVSIIGMLTFSLTSSYRRQRILAFLDPFSDPQGYSYHISQVLIALGSGGLFGLGVGQSRQKFEFIPEVTTDSIFAIIGEEFGFIGCLVLISLLSYLVYRGFKIAENAQDNFGRILAYGLTAWLGIQTVVNLGAMVSLIPLTGVPLPFISYGGSALLADLVAVGILINISKSAKL